MSKLFYFLFLSVLLSSCVSKDGDYGNPNDYPKYYLSDTIKAYNDFQEGSYWVYQDSVTKEIDSSFIFSRIRSADPNPDVQETKEHINVQRLIREDTIYVIMSYNTFYDFEFGSQLRVKNGIKGSIFKYISLRKSPLTDGQMFPELKPTVYDTLVLSNGDEYANVVAFTYVDDQVIGTYDESNFFRTCYFAKHLGMVKIEFRDGTVYELLRYNVKQ